MMTTAPDPWIACGLACAMNQTDIAHARLSVLQTPATAGSVVTQVQITFSYSFMLMLTISVGYTPFCSRSSSSFSMLFSS